MNSIRSNSQWLFISDKILPIEIALNMGLQFIVYLGFSNRQRHILRRVDKEPN